MGIQRIESLVFGADNVADATRYFDDWGLEATDRNEAGTTYTLPENQTIIIRDANDDALPTAPDGANTLRETIWGADTQGNLDAIRVELSKDRDVTTDNDGTLHSRDDAGFAIGFRVWDRTPAGIDAPQINMNDQNTRLNAPVDGYRRARPIRIGHVVFHVPAENWKALSGFYQDRLKFRLSERAEDTGDFMRCEGSQDHHNLFLAYRMDRAQFNHIAFEVRDFDEIMLGGAHMKEQGWEPATKPGRHFMGSNMFWYFHTPCGGRTEYFADMDRLTEDWKPPIWEKNPGYAMWIME